MKFSFIDCICTVSVSVLHQPFVFLTAAPIACWHTETPSQVVDCCVFRAIKHCFNVTRFIFPFSQAPAL